VTIFGGYGAQERGWTEVGHRLDWASARFRKGTLTYHPLAAGTSGDLGYAIGIEKGRARVADEHDSTGELVLRVTHLFRREHDQWKLIHRHADTIVAITTPREHLQPFQARP